MSLLKKLFWAPPGLQMLNMIDLTLHLVPGKEQPPPAQLFNNIVDVEYLREHNDYMILAAGAICNQIAFNARRGVGNVLFVPDQASKVIFEVNRLTRASSIESFIVDSSLAPNELRATYWRLMRRRTINAMHRVSFGEPVAVDGGVQFTEQGFRCVDNFEDYFTKCYL